MRWLALLLLPIPAFADEADDLLARVEAAGHRAEDAHIVLAIETTEAGGEPASRTLEIWQKGEDKRLIRYTEPARLAGVGLLVPDGETIYLYLPAYGRVRRVVGESRGDAFMGTDFAMEDLARLEWAEDYDPELVGPSHLKLVAREGRKTASARVEMDVRDDGLPTLVEHYDANGKLVRRIRFEDFREVGAHTLAHAITVEDAGRGRSTRATVASAAFDAGLSDDLFTVTALSR